MALLISHHDLEIDTPQILQHIKDRNCPQLLNGKQQIERITEEAFHQTPDMSHAARDSWTLEPFSNTLSARNALGTHTHRLGLITKLLNAIRTLIENYRYYLQLPSFQQFLLTCLYQIKTEYDELSRYIKRLDHEFLCDELIPGHIKQIFCNMTAQMERNLNDVITVTNDFSQLIRPTHFTEQQRSMLDEKITALNLIFLSLFNQNSELLNPMTGNTELQVSNHTTNNDVTASHPSESYVSSRQIIALSQLAHDCLNNSSYFSQQGYKGLVLRHLITKIDEQEHFTNAQFQEACRELARIVASFRQTYFFQAGYGRTRSATILLRAIKDPILQVKCPFGDIIFRTTGIDYSKKTDNELIELLQKTQATSHWVQASHELTMIPSFSRG
jgi:hypothetical protein